MLSGLLKRIDSSVRTIPVNDLARWTQREQVGLAERSRLLLAGRTRARDRWSRGIGARDRDGARRARARTSCSATDRRATKPSRSPSEIGGACGAGGRVVAGGRGAARRGGRRRRHPRQQRRRSRATALLARMSDDDWRAVIDTNLSSVFYTCRAVTQADDEEASRGTIVNISSIVGVHGNFGQTNYAASKAGIIGFTKSLARELGSRGVRANVVAPGYVKTQLTDVLPEEATTAMLDEHAARAPRRAARTWPGGTVPGLRRGLVHHGRGAARRRRTGDVGSGRKRKRTQARRRHRARDGELARERRRVVVAGVSSPASRAPARSRSSTRRDYPVHFACELKDFDPTDWIDRKAARRMDRFVQLDRSPRRARPRRTRAST